MAITPEFMAYLEDLFSVVPHTRIRKMFGGVGIFRHSLMFALAMGDGRIALKVDDETRSDFVAAGSSEWIYEHKTRKSVSMGYWYMPEFLADDPEAFAEWAEKAFSAAARIDQAKPPSQRKLKV